MRPSRYRTRLVLAMSTVTALSIVSMGAILILFAAGNVQEAYVQRGQMLNALVQVNIQYGASLPQRVLENVTNGLVLSSLLSAELVAAGEAGGESPERIRERLQRVIERSKAYAGEPLIDEFWITDADGQSYISTEGTPFQFPDDASQAGQFYQLLEPGANVVAPEPEPRNADGRRFLYAGAAGVDRERIVQVGIDATSIDDLQMRFEIDQVLDDFVEIAELNRIVVLDRDAQIVASAVRAGRGPALDPETRLFAMEHMTSDNDAFSLRFVSTEGGMQDISVATNTAINQQGDQAVLVMEYRVAPMMALIRRSTRTIVGIAVLLILVSVIVAWYMGRSLSSPLRQLASAARKYAGGAFDYRVAVKGAREFREVGQALNGMAASILQQMAALEKETQQRTRLESELRIGATVQQSLLPAEALRVDAFEATGWSQPAREVGGDFYDYALLPDGRVAIVIGDATDKGLPAALMSAECAGMIRALAQREHSPGAVLQVANDTMYTRLEDLSRFVTLFLAVLDPRTGQGTYACAGHNPPYVVHPHGGTQRLDGAYSLPLGIQSGVQYVDVPFEVAEGGFLVLYSDGLTDARNANGTLYGEAHLVEVLSQNSVASAPGLVGRIREAVEAYTEGSAQADDITLAVAFRGV